MSAPQTASASLLPPPGLRPALPPVAARLAVVALGRACFDTRLPWDRQRRRFDAATRLGRLGVPTPEPDVVGGVPVERVRPPAGATGGPVGRPGAGTVVHLHGGGFCVGTPAMARAWATALAARTGVTVLLPAYRLAPEHPCPAATEDAVAVATAVAGDGPLVLAGDSAGGGAALAAAHVLRHRSGVAVAGLVLHCPWVDLRPAADPGGWGRRQGRDGVLHAPWLAACARAYAAGRPFDDPAVSPVVGDLAGLPPMVVQAAGDDLLRADAEALAVRARAAGVDVHFTVGRGLWHDYGLQVGMAAPAELAVAQAAAAVSGWLAGAPQAR